MEKETVYAIVENVGEAVIGASIGLLLCNNVWPMCSNKLEKSITFGGTLIASWMAGKAWNKASLKAYDRITGEDHSHVIKSL